MPPIPAIFPRLLIVDRVAILCPFFLNSSCEILDMQGDRNGGMFVNKQCKEICYYKELVSKQNGGR